MPIYEYVCESCDQETLEVHVPVKHKPPVCELCNEDMVRLISANSFRLKGGGWEKDGYSKDKQG